MQWFASPRPLGTCYFVNDASMDELYEGLKTHKGIVKDWYPDYLGSHGVGLNAFVSKEDLVSGYDWCLEKSTGAHCRAL